jgi:single-strand DNA-binding protein
MSNVYVIGTLGTTPELRFGGSGTPWLTARVAVERRTKQDGEWKSETDWYNLKVFGSSAENLAASADKGHRLIIFGTLQIEQYKNKENEDKESLTIVADEVGIDLRFATTVIERAARADGKQQAPRAKQQTSYGEFTKEPF